jgi:hypothetical protein
MNEEDINLKVVEGGEEFSNDSFLQDFDLDEAVAA